MELKDLPELERRGLEAAIEGNPILTLPSEFDLFDPIADEVPSVFFDLRSIARRARAILEGVDREQIREAVRYAEDITSRRVIKLDEVGVPADDELEACRGEFDDLRPSTLLRRKSYLDRSKQGPPDGVRWYVVFASLALAYVAKSVNSGVYHGVEATDAVSIAEWLLKNTKAGKAPKQRTDYFKGVLANIIADNPGLKYVDYANLLLKSHSDEMINVRGQPFGKRAIAGWARDIIKKDVV